MENVNIVLGWLKSNYEIILLVTFIILTSITIFLYRQEKKKTYAYISLFLTFLIGLLFLYSPISKSGCVVKVIVGTLAGLVLCYLMFFIYIRRLTNKFRNSQISGTTYMKSLVEPHERLKTDITFEEPTRARLLEQHLRILHRAIYHLNLSIELYERYYVTLSMSILTGIIAAITFLYLGKDGWTKVVFSIDCVTIFFLIVVAASTFFLTLLKVFKHSDNITKNETFYLRYADLANELESFCSTGKNREKTEVTPRDFIIHIDTSLESSSFGVVFDPTKVKGYLDIAKEISSSKDNT